MHADWALHIISMWQLVVDWGDMRQGGTCVVIGDEHARVTEAAKAAERHLKCKVMRSSPFWRKEGFSQELHNKEVMTLPSAVWVVISFSLAHRKLLLL
jgi:hypothetical protein